MICRLDDRAEPIVQIAPPLVADAGAVRGDHRDPPRRARDRGREDARAPGPGRRRVASRAAFIPAPGFVIGCGRARNDQDHVDPYATARRGAARRPVPDPGRDPRAGGRDAGAQRGRPGAGGGVDRTRQARGDRLVPMARPCRLQRRRRQVRLHRDRGRAARGADRRPLRPDRHRPRRRRRQLHDPDRGGRSSRRPRRQSLEGLPGPDLPQVRAVSGLLRRGAPDPQGPGRRSGPGAGRARGRRAPRPPASRSRSPGGG